MRTVERRIREPRTRHEGRLEAIMKAGLLKRVQLLEKCELPNPAPLNCSSATSRSCHRITPENDTSLPWAGYRTGSTNGKSGQARRQRMKTRAAPRRSSA